MAVQILHGDCIDVMRAMDGACIDAIVTDPPYEISMMGRKWDTTGIANSVEVWREAYRVLKPGGHLLAFSGSRTYHRMVCAIEDAGFEIRDQIMWLYGTGFPKSRNLKDEWVGWGTALKPSHEPIVVARKPLIGTVAANVLEHGTGALNIDACRVDGGPIASAGGTRRSGGIMGASEPLGGWEPKHSGRWPANCIWDGSDEVLAAFAAFGERKGSAAQGTKGGGSRSVLQGLNERVRDEGYQDTGTAARFFYSAKASKADRAGSKHPTVKPISLMRYLCKLVTAPGGTVLDPFCGSGTTLQAAQLEGFSAIGIEREADYVTDARRRLGLTFNLEAAD